MKLWIVALLLSAVVAASGKNGLLVSGSCHVKVDTLIEMIKFSHHQSMAHTLRPLLSELVVGLLFCTWPNGTFVIEVELIAHVDRPFRLRTPPL